MKSGLFSVQNSDAFKFQIQCGPVFKTVLKNPTKNAQISQGIKKKLTIMSVIGMIIASLGCVAQVPNLNGIQKMNKYFCDRSYAGISKAAILARYKGHGGRVCGQIWLT